MSMIRLNIKEIRRGRRLMKKFKTTRAFRNLLSGRTADMNNMTFGECLAIGSATEARRYKHRRTITYKFIRKEIQ